MNGIWLLQWNRNGSNGEFYFLNWSITLVLNEKYWKCRLGMKAVMHQKIIDYNFVIWEGVVKLTASYPTADNVTISFLKYTKRKVQEPLVVQNQRKIFTKAMKNYTIWIVSRFLVLMASHTVQYFTITHNIKIYLFQLKTEIISCKHFEYDICYRERNNERFYIKINNCDEWQAISSSKNLMIPLCSNP